jgi:hypothetical protein
MVKVMTIAQVLKLKGLNDWQRFALNFQPKHLKCEVRINPDKTVEVGDPVL